MKAKFYSIYQKENLCDEITKNDLIISVSIPKKYQGHSKKAIHYRNKLSDKLHFSYGFDCNLIVTESFKGQTVDKNYIKNFKSF